MGIQEKHRKEFSAERLWGVLGDRVATDDEEDDDDDSDQQTSKNMQNYESKNKKRAVNQAKNVRKSDLSIPDFHLKGSDFLDSSSFMDLSIFSESSNYPKPSKKVHTDSDQLEKYSL